MVIKLSIPKERVNVVIFDYIQGITIHNDKKIMDSSDELKLVDRLRKISNQGYYVCQRTISEAYAKKAIEFPNSLLVAVFEDRRGRVLREVYDDKLLGFVSCTYRENNGENNGEEGPLNARETVKNLHIDLICASSDKKAKGLGSVLMRFINSYAKHYSINVISLEAATIELACNFYDKKFNFKFKDRLLDCDLLRRRRLRSNKTEDPLAKYDHERMFNMTFEPSLYRTLTRTSLPPRRFRPYSMSGNGRRTNKNLTRKLSKTRRFKSTLKKKER